MRRIYWIPVLLGVLTIGACAAAAPPPTSEARSALTPSGNLRVGILLTTALQVTKDAVSGELKGVSIDLGKELARRLGVPFAPVGYTSIDALIAGAGSGQWDIAFLAIEPAREKDLDYAAAFMEVELTYLVPAGSSIKDLSDVDKPGIRVAVANKGGPDILLSRTLKHAVLVRADGVPAMFDTLITGKADAAAANRPTLLIESERIRGSRVLDGRVSTVQYGIATVKGQDAGKLYVRKFVEDAKTEGLVKSAIERAGLRGVVVARP